MSDTTYSFVTTIMTLLATFTTLVVMLVAAGTAISMGMKKIGPVGMWLIAATWCGMAFLMGVSFVSDWVLMPRFGWEIARWISMLVELCTLFLGLLMGVGYMLLRPAPAAHAPGSEASHV